MLRLRNEAIGDPATHLAKTGNIIRRRESVDGVNEISAYLRGLRLPVPVEYDVVYHGAINEIRGYSYNELMRGIQVYPVGSRWNGMLFDATAGWQDEDDRIAREMMARNGDKYVMECPRNAERPDKVVFLPGTNMLGFVDGDELGRLVARGFVIKPHPLTEERCLHSLRGRYGHKVVLGRRVSGFWLYQGAREVASIRNTEFGVLALLEGKPWYEILAYSPRDRVDVAYKRFYDLALSSEAFATTPGGMIRRALNCPHSGLVFPWQVDWKDRLRAFFDLFADYPHGRPETDGK